MPCCLTIRIILFFNLFDIIVRECCLLHHFFDGDLSWRAYNVDRSADYSGF